MGGPEAQMLRERLVAELVANGHLTSQRWREAFWQVPRHEFVAGFFRQLPAGEYRAVDRADSDWLESIYSDDVLVTQLDGDNRLWETASASPVAAEATSSSSQPRLMADMLEALEVHDGHRVLEIGTGTGYNAGLLAHRLGSDYVTTVDVARRSSLVPRRCCTVAVTPPRWRWSTAWTGTCRVRPTTGSSPPARSRRCRLRGSSRPAPAGWS